MDQSDVIARAIAREQVTSPVESRQALASLRKNLFGVDSEPERIGRYVVVRRLGEGAHGVVYSAYDPGLERKVAIKLLRAPGAGRGGDDARLLREAQAIARITHRNVVTVHDVGACDPDSGWPSGSVYMVMEYVEGRTLRAWLDQAEPSRAQILDKLEQAALGLEAAHLHRLAHRDFKPDNVLVTTEGVVKVLDFGLARTVSSPWPVDPVPSDSSGLLTRTLTQAGAVMGTPAYMSPEQHAGEVAGPSADVFALCVTVFEALGKERPFRQRDLEGLAAAKRAGLERPAFRGRGIPRALRDLLRRGLSPDPEQRPDVGEVLDRFRAVRRARVRRPALAVLTGLGVAIGLASVDEPPCGDGAARLEGTWDGERSHAVAQAFAVSGSTISDATLESVTSRLDDYAAGWRETYEDACRGSHVRRDQSERMLDLRMACLEYRRRDLASLVDVFAEADEGVVNESLSAVDKLESIQLCSDPEFLEASVRPPSEPLMRTQVALERERLARLRARFQAGRYPDPGQVEAAVSQARSLEHAPLLAEVLGFRGRLENRLGEYVAARETLRECYWVARRARYPKLAAECAVDLMGSLVRLGEFESGAEWGRHADAELGSLGPAPGLRIYWWEQQSRVRAGLGDYEGATEAAEEAVALSGTAGASSLRLASALTSLGGLLYAKGEHSEAIRPIKQVLEFRLEGLHEEHPLVASAHNNLGAVLLESGDLRGAEEHLRRAIEIRENVVYPEHPQTAGSVLNLGLVHIAAGRHAEGVDTLLLADSMVLDRRGTGDSSPMKVQLGLADAFSGLGLRDASLDAADRALALHLMMTPRNHPESATVLAAMGRAAPLSVEKLALLDEAVEVLEFNELENGVLAEALTNRGRVYLDLGDAEGARVDATRALPLVFAHLPDPQDAVNAISIALEAGLSTKAARSTLPTGRVE